MTFAKNLIVKAIDRPLWGIILCAYLLLLIVSISDNARGPSYPEILTLFDLSNSRGALIFALSSLAGLLANLSTRWWFPQLGIINGIIVSLIILTAGLFLFGFSSFMGLLFLDISCFLIGFGMGMSNVLMTIMVVQASPINSRRQFLSGLHAVYGFGSLTAPLLIGLFVSMGSNWAIFYMSFALLPLLFLPVIYFGQNKYLTKLKKVKGEPKKKLTPPTTFLNRLSYGLLLGIYVAAEIIISSRLVLYLYSANDISIDVARICLSIFFLFLMLGRLFVALVPLAIRNSSLMIISCVAGIFIYFLGLLISPYFFVLLGLSMSFFFPVGMSWLSQKFPDGVEWMTASVLTTVGVVLIFMHLMFGVIADFIGIHFAMATVPFMLAICIILIFLKRWEDS